MDYKISSATLGPLAVIGKEYLEMLLIVGAVLFPEQARQVKEARAHRLFLPTLASI